MIVNKIKLAEIIGVTPQAITKWQKNGMPVIKTGGRGQGNKYDTKKVIDWLAKREVKKIKRGSDGQYRDLSHEKARLTHHRANRTDLDEQKVKKDLIPAETVENFLSNMKKTASANFLSIPTDAAPQVVNLSNANEIKAVLTKTINDSLKKLGDNMPNL